MLTTSFLAAVLVAGAQAAPQLILNTQAQQEPFTIAALEQHLTSVPEGFSVDLDEQRLVQFSEDAGPVVITEREKFIIKAQGLKFMDLSEVPSHVQPVKQEKEKYGVYSVANQVKSVIKTLSTDGPRKNLEKFTSFTTRYYKSSNGRKSQLWLLEKVAEITAATASAALRDSITLSEFSHPWGQNSIIAKIKGSAGNGSVIISAHQDSTNIFPFLPAPGADDDGSGTVTILEAYRALLAANYTPIHDVEFHWYSAEEGGLLGSQAVAADYAAKEAKVKAQVQFDMTAWVAKGTREEVGIITDFTDPELTDFITSLIDKYLSIPWTTSKCGYACSDHASWFKYGYPSAFGIESAFENDNKNIHSSNDRINVSPEFSFEHMLEFSKLAVAYVIEVAGWH